MRRRRKASRECLEIQSGYELLSSGTEAEENNQESRRTKCGPRRIGFVGLHANSVIRDVQTMLEEEMDE